MKAWNLLYDEIPWIAAFCKKQAEKRMKKMDKKTLALKKKGKLPSEDIKYKVIIFRFCIH